MDGKEKDFKYFLENLIRATARIEKHYFQQPVTGIEYLKMKERVYCYELYHHLRCTLGDVFPYKLDGEYDKSGHPIIVGDKKPDFIVHVPGNMDNNLVIIEVKSTDADKHKICEDIEKFKIFLEEGNNKPNYFRAIMLIYGNSNKNSENKLKSIRTEIDSLPEHSERILLLWHKECGKPAEVINHARTA